MISKHCGKRLTPLTGNRPKDGTHIWVCSVCKREFRQRVRQKHVEYHGNTGKYFAYAD